MNTDADPYRIPASDYSYAMNITRDAIGEGQDMVVSTVVGNSIIPYLLPNAECKVIGSRPDSVRNRIYYFIWDTQGEHSIMYYDGITQTVNKLLLNLADTDDVDILNFNPSYRINHIDIIYRDDKGDLLYWTDGYNRPRVINVQDAIDGVYGTSWKAEYLTVARPMPNLAPTSSYQNDSTVAVNNLRKTLYQFRYRWVYKDDTKSTWSPYGKFLAPLNPDDIADNLDPEKNNRIDVTVQTGGLDCVKIEIAAREIFGTNVFSDDYVIATIEKGDTILSDDFYTFQFFNDSAYPYVEQRESTLLFDYVPAKAYTQALPNGNVLTYGAITEGINFDFSMDVETEVDAIPYSQSEPFIAQSANPPRVITFTFSGDPQPTDTVTVTVTQAGVGTFSDVYTIQIGDTLADIRDYFITAINATTGSTDLFATDTSGGSIVSLTVEDLVDPSPGRVGGSVVVNYIAATPTTDSVSNSIYKSNSKYRFGLVYFDDFGVTDGYYTDDNLLVITPELTTTGGLESDIPNITAYIHHTPPINATHFSWVRTLNQTVSSFIAFVSCDVELDGTKYQYIEVTNLQNNESNFPAYEYKEGDRVRVIGEFSAGAAGTVAVYDFPLIGLVVDPTASTPITAGTYLKIPYDSSAALVATKKYFCEVYTPAVNTDLGAQIMYEFGETYAIIDAGTENRSHNGNRQRQVIGTTGSIVRPSVAPLESVTASAGNLSNGDYYYRVAFGTADGEMSAPSPASTVATTSTGNQQVALTSIPTGAAGVTKRFIYRTKVDGSEYYLLATINDNTTTTYNDNIADTALVDLMPQPAISNFTRGDVYYRNRLFPTTADLTTTNNIFITDLSVSDLYSSNVRGNGRAFSEHSDAEKETYYPTLIRFGGEFQQNTTVNNTNRFYFDSQDTYDRANGDIRKLHVEGRSLYVFQKFDIGVVPILTQVVRDTTGNPLEANSDILLNKIQYPYKGKFGIGDCPESFAYYRYAKYFVDPTKGVVCRLSQDGLTPLSTVYGMNAFFSSRLKNFRKDLNTGIVPEGQFYYGDPTVIGCFDYYTNKYIVALEQIVRYNSPTSDPYFTQGLSTVVYWESDFEQMKGFETFLSLYPESMVCLDNQLFSFSFGRIAIHNNTEDYCRFFGVRGDAEIDAVFNDNALQKKTFTAMTQLGSEAWKCTTIRTSTGQVSQIPEQKFVKLEGNYHAPFFRASNSVGGLANGQTLKGNYIIVKFEKSSVTGFVSLNLASVKYINSPLTNV